MNKRNLIQNKKIGFSFFSFLILTLFYNEAIFSIVNNENILTKNSSIENYSPTPVSRIKSEREKSNSTHDWKAGDGEFFSDYMKRKLTLTNKTEDYSRSSWRRFNDISLIKQSTPSEIFLNNKKLDKNSSSFIKYSIDNPDYVWWKDKGIGLPEDITSGNFDIKMTQPLATGEGDVPFFTKARTDSKHRNFFERILKPGTNCFSSTNPPELISDNLNLWDNDYFQPEGKNHIHIVDGEQLCDMQLNVWSQGGTLIQFNDINNFKNIDFIDVKGSGYWARMSFGGYDISKMDEAQKKNLNDIELWNGTTGWDNNKNDIYTTIFIIRFKDGDELKINYDNQFPWSTRKKSPNDVPYYESFEPSIDVKNYEENTYTLDVNIKLNKLHFSNLLKENKYLFINKKERLDNPWWLFSGIFFDYTDDFFDYNKKEMVNIWDKFALPWLDIYLADHTSGNYNLVDTKVLFNDDSLWSGIKKHMPSDVDDYTWNTFDPEFNFTVQIKNNLFKGPRKDNIIADFVGYNWWHNVMMHNNSLEINSQKVYISLNNSFFDFQFDYFINPDNLDVSITEENIRFRFNILFKEDKYENIKDLPLMIKTTPSQNAIDTKFKFPPEPKGKGRTEIDVQIPKTEFSGDAVVQFYLKGMNDESKFIKFTKHFSTKFTTSISYDSTKTRINRLESGDLLIKMIIVADKNIKDKDKFLFWEEPSLTMGTYSSDWNMLNDKDEKSYKINREDNMVELYIKYDQNKSTIDGIDELNFSFGYSDSPTYPPEEGKTTKKFTNSHFTPIPPILKTQFEKIIEKIIILTSVVAFFIIFAFSSGITLLIRSNKQTRMVMNSLNDDLFDPDNVDEDFELSL